MTDQTPDKKRPFVMGFFLIIVVMVTLFVVNESSRPRATEIPFSTFIAMVDSDKVSDVTIVGNDIVGKGVAEKGTTTYHSVANAPTVEILLRKLEEKKTPYRIREPADTAWHGNLLLLIGGMFLLYLCMGSLENRQGKQLGQITSSKVKFHTPVERTTFADVAGADEAVARCRGLVEFLKDPARFQKLGARVPKGILLVGPSGTGKTLLARAIAGEAGVPFLFMSGSEFVEMFVGVGASRVRDLFETARKAAPCILFIDEIDAVGQRRGQGVSGGGHDEREQTLNQILVEMDGFKANVGVMVIAATNRPEVLDKALKRKGRFDREVTVDRPDIKGREAILKIHTKRIPLASDVDLSVIARGTPGFTGADLEGLVNEAALLSAERNKSAVDGSDLEAARDMEIMGGKERKTAVISERVKRIIAFHEAGHTVAAWFEPDADPVHKVSIIPRGQALGVTMHLPLEDQLLSSKEELVAHLRTLYGGRVAEQLAIGRITTGASNDLQVATSIARSIVTVYGMSEAAGHRTFGQRQIGFLGIEEGVRDYSEETAQVIDAEIKKLLDDAYTHVERLLTEHRAHLDAVANALLQHETLAGPQLEELLGTPAFRRD